MHDKKNFKQKHNYNTIHTFLYTGGKFFLLLLLAGEQLAFLIPQLYHFYICWLGKGLQ